MYQAEEEVEQFLKEEHTFLEYEKLVYKYQDVVSELQYSVEKVPVENIHVCLGCTYLGRFPFLFSSNMLVCYSHMYPYVRVSGEKP